MKVQLVFFIVLIIIISQSCKKSVDFEVPEIETTIVVDGMIEQNDFPYVILTESTPFFNDYDAAKLRRMVVASAKVTVSDGETEEVLTLVKQDEFFPSYLYRGYLLKGEIGKTYQLKIEWKEKIFESTTTMLPPVNISSLMFEALPRHSDTLGIVRLNFNDPQDKINYYRTFTKILNTQERFYPFHLSTQRDKYYNGQNYTFTVFKGLENLYDKKENIYFDKNDTVIVKFCSIDKMSFLFWTTVEREMSLSGNPLSISGKKVETNISNGALGCWTAYSYSLDTIIINFDQYYSNN